MVITCLSFDDLLRNNYNRLEIIMQHFCWAPLQPPLSSSSAHYIPECLGMWKSYCRAPSGSCTGSLLSSVNSVVCIFSLLFSSASYNSFKFTLVLICFSSSILFVRNSRASLAGLDVLRWIQMY